MKKLLIITILILGFSQVKAQDIYKTPKGNRYHLASCRMVNNVSTKIKKTQGLSPCGICKPPASSRISYGSSKNKAVGKARTTQCKGITKRGTRCKHKTSMSNGLCYQHGN